MMSRKMLCLHSACDLKMSLHTEQCRYAAYLLQLTFSRKLSVTARRIHQGSSGGADEGPADGVALPGEEQA